jgi:hypothetical protein
VPRLLTASKALTTESYPKSLYPLPRTRHGYMEQQDSMPRDYYYRGQSQTQMTENDDIAWIRYRRVRISTHFLLLHDYLCQKWKEVIPVHALQEPVYDLRGWGSPGGLGVSECVWKNSPGHGES